MRDIKPHPKKITKFDVDPPRDEVPPETKKLYEQLPKKTSEGHPQAKHENQPPKRSKPRLTGNAVPVTNVHAPKQVPHVEQVYRAGDSSEEHDKKPTHDELSENPKKTAVPLFASVPKSKQKKKGAAVRIGHKERKIAALLLLLALIAAGLAAYIFLPTANITLVIETAPLLIDETLTVSQAPAGPNGLVGTPYVREVTVEGAAPVTSEEVVGEKAHGTATIINRTTEEQQIKAQSRLVTDDGTLYYMQGPAFVPAEGTFTVDVEAAEAGPQFNVEAGTLQFAALDSSAQSVLYAEVASAISGGSGDTVTVVRESDIQSAQEAAGATAKEQVEANIRAELLEGWSLIEESWETELTEFETAAEEGDQTDTIPYTARAIVRVMGYEETKLQDSLKTTLQEDLDENYMLFPGPVSFTKSVDSIDWEKGSADITVRVTHTTIPMFSLDTLKEKLAGRNTDEALSYVQGLKGVTSASVDTWPFWATSVPTIEQRIELNLVNDRQP